MAKKNKRFGMHPNLLMDVIRRQAGTLAKAILEGIMNSIEAGVSRIDIALDSETLILTDDGRGFPDETAIEKYFNTFGQPHEASEGKIYANFRMGRGQLFSFGANIWESGNFLMDVDVKNRGLDWEFNPNANTGIDGCQVTVFLYKQLTPSELLGIERDIAKQAKYVATPVHFNDKLISQDPAEQQWDYESDHCYLRLKETSSIAVYNLGVFVKDMHAREFGVGGELVSKQQLKLNFARNDIMVSECPVWRDARKFLEKASGIERKKKPSMNDAERQRLADQMLTGELDRSELFEARIFTDIGGRHWSMTQLARQTSNYPQWSVAAKGDRLADKIHQSRSTFVFSQATLDRFDCESPQAFMANLKRAATNGLDSWLKDALLEWPYVPFSTIAKSFSREYRLIDKNDWNVHEQVWQACCSYEGGLLQSHLDSSVDSRSRRKILIGSCEQANGWTDGSSYIAIDREFLRDKSLGSISDIIMVGRLLLHEYCHSEPDSCEHEHTQEFYELFHNAAGGIAVFADAVLRNLPQRLANMNRKMTREQARAQDQLHRLNHATTDLAPPVAANAKG